MAKKLRRKVLGFALPIVGGLLGGPLGAAAASGAYGYSQNHNIGSALLSAGGSYLGARIGGAYAGNAGNVGPAGTVGSALNSAFGSGPASTIGSIIGPSNFGADLGSTLGSMAGSQLGANVASSLVPQKTANASGTMAAFTPKRESEEQPSPSIMGAGGFNPEQYTSGIATQGVYGGGASPQDTDYFLNQINRRLITDQGQVDENLNDVNAIENSYLSQLGLGGMGNARDLLEAISRYRATA